MQGGAKIKWAKIKWSENLNEAKFEKSKVLNEMEKYYILKDSSISRNDLERKIDRMKNENTHDDNSSISGSVDALPVLGRGVAPHSFLFSCAYCCTVLHSIIHFFLFLGEGGGLVLGGFRVTLWNFA